MIPASFFSAFGTFVPDVRVGTTLLHRLDGDTYDEPIEVEIARRRVVTKDDLPAGMATIETDFVSWTLWKSGGVTAVNKDDKIVDGRDGSAWIVRRANLTVAGNLFDCLCERVR